MTFMDMTMEFVRKLPIPKDLKEKYPLDEDLKALKARRDQEMKDLGKEEGKAEGRIEERKDILNKMIARGFSKEDILKLDFTELEYNAAKKDAE